MRLLLSQTDLFPLKDQVRIVVRGPVQDDLHIDGDRNLGIPGARALEGNAPGLRLHGHVADTGYIQDGPGQHLRIRSGDIDAVGQRVVHQRLPREGHVANVRRHGYGKVQGVVVNGTLPHVVEFRRDSCK